EMRRDVASAPRIGVVAPCPADLVGAFKDKEIVLARSFQTDCHSDAGKPGTNDHHSIGTRRISHGHPPTAMMAPVVRRSQRGAGCFIWGALVQSWCGHARRPVGRRKKPLPQGGSRRR